MKRPRLTLAFFVALTSGLALASSLTARAKANSAEQPNVVFILADDLGYGDVGAMNPEGKIATPHLDRLAAEGMIFTDAHSSSAVCTPTRYGILTGRYNWRSRLQRGVLNGYSPPLIDADRATVGALMKQHGYATACVGKWHLGMNWAKATAEDSRRRQGRDNIRYDKPIQDGPIDRGFDYYFGIAASLDMPPYVFIENDMATEVPTTTKKWIRSGPAGEDFEAVDVLPRLAEKTVAFIDRQVKNEPKKPFFIYMPLNSPHTPIVPTKPWQGRSDINKYADFVMQTDAAVGDVLAALERHKLADNTLVIFTSDNGCSPQANFRQLAQHDHDPSYVFRGHKADIFEGGHRVPFIARWAGRVKPGTKSDQTICLIDLMATCADVLDVELPPDAGVDSVSILPALLGKAERPLREATVHHSINGSFAIREGDWKLILCPGSGGWSSPRSGRGTKGLPPVQLYNLADDPAEENNVQAEQPEVVRRLATLLEKYVAEGRSTPGEPQKNDAQIDIYKGHRPEALQGDAG